MKIDRSFATYRYFIVPVDQISLFDTVEKKRGSAVAQFFNKAQAEKNSAMILVAKNIFLSSIVKYKTMF